jgi:membrane protein YdbS with pleckstrin-like domain
MYEAVKTLVVRLLRAPSRPPEAPAGSHDSVQVFRASPRYLTYRLLVYYLSSAAALCGLAVGGVATAAGGEWGGFAAVALSGAPVLFGLALGWFGVRIEYDLRYYIVTDRSLRVREGAWIVKEKTITYANVQNLRVVQGPLQRLFGIWDLKIDTAGGGGKSKQEKGTGGSHAVNMAGIENAYEVRDLVLSYLRAGAGGGSGLGDPDDEDDGRSAASPLASPAVLAALRSVRAAAGDLQRTARGLGHAG